MSSNVKYPNVTVKLIGEDGNAFAIIGAISRALRREVSADAAQQYQKEATSCTSYDELLQHAMSTVEVI